jgi:GT2 family glycosyltransferase
MTLAMPRLSIVIVSYNARAELEACLASLVAHPPSVDHEIVVVDNASMDGTPAALRERWTGVHLIEAGANVGFARANNLGIRQTFGELVLLLNGDTIVPPRAVDALVRVLDQRPDVAVVGPRLVDATGRPELSFGPMIGPFAEIWQKTLVRGLARGIAPIVAYVGRETAREHEVDWVSGACLLVRRADAEAAGLLDERYFMYTEDVDFCAAIRARGRTVLFTPAATVVHLRGRSVASAPRATEAAYRRSQLAFYAKHHPAWMPLLRAYLRVRGRLPDNPEDRSPRA